MHKIITLKAASPLRYKKYSLTASFLKPFKLYQQNFSFDSLLYYQKSEDILFSPQRISLGGISSVRGFKDQSLSGNAVELNLRGTYFAASLSAAHSLKRPQILEDRERPIYFRVEVFY